MKREALPAHLPLTPNQTPSTSFSGGAQTPPISPLMCQPLAYQRPSSKPPEYARSPAATSRRSWSRLEVDNSSAADASDGVIRPSASSATTMADRNMYPSSDDSLVIRARPVPAGNRYVASGSSASGLTVSPWRRRECRIP